MHFASEKQIPFYYEYKHKTNQLNTGQLSNEAAHVIDRVDS